MKDLTANIALAIWGGELGAARLEAERLAWRLLWVSWREENFMSGLRCLERKDHSPGTSCLVL